MNNDPTAAGEDCILASLERPSNYRLYYKIEPQARNVVEGDSKSKTFKLQTTLLIRKVKLKKPRAVYLFQKFGEKRISTV